MVPLTKEVVTIAFQLFASEPRFFCNNSIHTYLSRHQNKHSYIFIYTYLIFNNLPVQAIICACSVILSNKQSDIGKQPYCFPHRPNTCISYCKLVTNQSSNTLPLPVTIKPPMCWKFSIVSLCNRVTIQSTSITHSITSKKPNIKRTSVPRPKLTGIHLVQ